jgi:Protein of unknown function (DUF1997)
MQFSSDPSHSLNPLRLVLPNYADEASPADVVMPEAGMSDRTGHTQFSSRFTDCMVMNANVEAVATYLDNHPEWFSRCARPMQVEAIGQTGYALKLGRFGSLGYEIEPKIGLDLLPADGNIYRIQTIDVPNYSPVGYSVDFQASLELKPGEPDPSILTRVEWVLDLKVYILFPKFIQSLPQGIIQNTGDGVLHQIVRQISRRLTKKVQEDFHQRQ